MSTISRREPWHAPGFTLVEILVVLVILGLVAGIAMPLLGRSLAGTGQRAAVTELRIALQAAGTEAVAQGRTVVFRTDPGGYWIGARHFRLTDAAHGRLRVGIAGAGWISFYPWGGSSGGRVQIDGADGRRELAVDVVSGRAVLSR